MIKDKTEHWKLLSRSMTLSEPSSTNDTMKLTTTCSDDFPSSVYEDPATVRPAIIDGNQPEVEVKPVPRPRSKKPKPQCNDNYSNPDNITNPTKYQNNEHPAGHGSPRPLRPPPRPPAPTLSAVRRSNSYGGSKTDPAVKSSQNNEQLTEHRRSQPSRPPPRPPAPTEAAVSRSRSNGGSKTDPAVKPPPPPCSPPPPPPRPPVPERPPPPLYCDRPQSPVIQKSEAPNRPVAVPRLRQSSFLGSASGCETSPPQLCEPSGTNNTMMVTTTSSDEFPSSIYEDLDTMRIMPQPPSFNPPPPESSECSESVYSEIEMPTYMEILPEDSEEMHITGLLRWLKRISKSNCMAPSLYGLSIEDEIRSFNRRAVNVMKALRLYNHLMMKRKENMQNIITEFRSICGTLDKIQRKNKTMTIAGGTTGAVGGVTAVMGLALAPVTLGASLIATAVGAGMVASAGGIGAHAAKANKKIVNRTTVERLVYDYMADIVDVELCLNVILSGMNELRRHDIARLLRARADPDAVKMAHRSEAVCRNMNCRGASTAHTSEKLLQAFAKEMDQYFSDKDSEKLKKSCKSRFSGRLCLLAKNLQDELNYLNEMWEMFNS